MMWFDEDGADPDYPHPYLEQWDEGSWVHWDLDHLPELEIHPQEVLDNMCDNRHLGPTHGAPCEYFENEMRDHVLIQRQGGAMTLYGGAMLYTTTWYTGPGVLLSKQVWEMPPVRNDCEHTRRRWQDQGMAWLPGEISHRHVTPEDKEMAKAIQAGALEAFSKDFEIWQTRRQRSNPWP